MLDPETLNYMLVYNCQDLEPTLRNVFTMFWIWDHMSDEF